jgi:[histone H3]-lysine79 N-trimethyltransferase
MKPTCNTYYRYGELLPRFTSEIANLTGLGPSSTFVDLGSGVGNVLVQLALQTGCSAYGCEMMETPASLADAQIEEAKARWAMWGLDGGRAEAWKGDFCASERVGEVLRKADVVLVNK